MGTTRRLPSNTIGRNGYLVLLVAITLYAYVPVRHYGFTNYDDPQYVTQNPNLAGGLTWNGIKWAFTTGYQSNWHPLTWLSHMLDVQLFDTNAGAHHLTNVGFHVANTLLLFWVLVQLTANADCSALIAGLFAVHPLHVESVAWIAERKDVLSTFFWILTLGAYVLYVRRPRKSTYLSVLMFFALGLMAKPMLVTLPFVLLLLDFWPLRRFKPGDSSNIPELLWEKVPLLVLTGISSFVTFFVQQAGGSVVGVETIPISSRVANAFIAYFTYLQETFWPTRLAVLYPAVLEIRDWWWAAALGLVALSIVSISARKRWPYIPLGWFWYLGTLVPVIGLVQVGRQATADRYTYVPLIGLFIIVAFGMSDALSGLRSGKLLFLVMSGLTIAACLWITRTQLRYWTDSKALWTHTLDVTGENALAHFNLAVALGDEGKLDEAMPHYAEAVRIDPTLRSKPQYLEAQYDWANLLINAGGSERLEQAASHLAEAIRSKPDIPEAHNALGIDYMAQGKLDQAEAEFAEAIRLKPDYASAHNNLGTALGNQGQVERAISEYREAVSLDPALADAHGNLGILLAKEGKVDDAIAQFSEVLRIDPNDPVARTWLANLSARTK